MADFCMPSLGADMQEGTLVEWLVKPGDRVKRRDVVAELAHRRLDLRGVLPGLAELADLLGDRVAAPLELFGDREELAAASVEFEHLVHERRVGVAVTKALADLLGLFADALDV